MLQRRQQGCDGRLLKTLDPFGEIADLHRAGIRDADPFDFRRPGRLGQAGAATLGTGGEGDRPLHESADVRLHRVDVLGQHRLLDRRDQPRIRQVDAFDLDLGGLLVEQRVQFLLRVLADRLVRVEEATTAEDVAVPAVHAVAGNGQRALVERLAVVVQRSQVDVVDRAPALAARTHAAGDRKAATFLHHLSAPLQRDRTRSTYRGDIEGKGLRRADVRFPKSTEHDAQHGVGVGGGADRGARVGTHPLLADDDRGGRPVQDVDVGPRQRRHEALHERAVGLVDQPLRLRGDRVEHQRTLARARDAGEHSQPALRDLDTDVLEVVLARAVYTDQIMAVGSVPRRRPRVLPRGPAHRLFRSTAARTSAVNAFSSILSPSWKSMARRVLPSRLELNSPFGSSKEAPLAKVTLTLSAYVSPVQIIPSWYHVGTPRHFHSSTQSESSLILASINCEGESVFAMVWSLSNCSLSPAPGSGPCCPRDRARHSREPRTAA